MKRQEDSKQYRLENGLKKQAKECLVIMDDGPGIDPVAMKDVLTSFGKGPQQHVNKLSQLDETMLAEDLLEFDSSEHGIGLKISAMRLANSCLILSKT